MESEQPRTGGGCPENADDAVRVPATANRAAQRERQPGCHLEARHVGFEDLSAAAAKCLSQGKHGME